MVRNLGLKGHLGGLEVNTTRCLLATIFVDIKSYPRTNISKPILQWFRSESSRISYRVWLILFRVTLYSIMLLSVHCIFCCKGRVAQKVDLEGCGIEVTLMHQRVTTKEKADKYDSKKERT